jgi:hypothetical protein
MRLTNSANDAGPPEDLRRLVLGVEVGDPFCSRSPELLVCVGVSHRDCIVQRCRRERLVVNVSAVSFSVRSYCSTKLSGLLQVGHELKELRSECDRLEGIDTECEVQKLLFC